jgi:hypothetical protein
MSTFAIELPNDQAERLQREAERQGLHVEDLLRKVAESYLSRADAFETAAAYVLQKNAELYRRLAK